MNKNDLKRILMSLRTTNNETQVNNLLGKIDLLPEEKLQQIIAQIGDNEESIIKYLQEKLIQTQNNRQEKNIPINKIFEYGITGNCIHLHLPIDLHEMIDEIGIKKTMDTVNLYLLDAIEKIQKLKLDDYYKFNSKDFIYMISPILFGKELKFLEELEFETHFYRKRELQNENFVAEHPEAQRAVQLFGINSNVGTAKLGIDIINSVQWQTKKTEKVKYLEEQGITLKEDDNSKNIDES